MSEANDVSADAEATDASEGVAHEPYTEPAPDGADGAKAKSRWSRPRREKPATADRAPREKREKKPSRRAERRQAKRAKKEAHAEAQGLVSPVARADRFTFTDLVVEATTDIGSRPGRLIMTLVGTILGIGALVATFGFAQTAAHQIARQFDAVKATQVVVKPTEAETATGASVATSRLPWDAAERVDNLVGVESAALLADVALGTDVITAVPVNDPAAPAAAQPPLIAATPDFVETLRGEVITGRTFDAGTEQRGDRVVMLGARAAERLGINRVDSQPSVFIGDVPYSVIGIFGDIQARGDLLESVVIPMSTARADRQLGAPSELQIRIQLGTGPQVGEQSAIALAPGATDTLEVVAPSSSSKLGDNVQADVNVIFLILGGIVLLAGALGIANVTMLTVIERIPEIGLRRALGATRRQIAAQFMVESIVLGLLGGLLGAAIAVIAVVLFAVSQQWTPIVNPWIAVGGAVLGAVVGLVAGGFPARRAARIEPVTALRGGR